MAPNKKKKKPAANPARGFATTSIASKPVARIEATDASQNGPKTPVAKAGSSGAAADETPCSSSQPAGPVAARGDKKAELTAEEFEAQLEESELQMLVEKHAAKVKRDAQRQITRLDTDRRLLRSQAEPINCPKWLPQELLDHVLGLISAESRYSTSSVSSDTSSSATGKLPPEEDLTVRLWTLQQVLRGINIPAARVQTAVEHILKISPNISSTVKDGIWGLEEALEHLAKECPLEELPSYDVRPRQNLKVTETPTDSAAPSRATTPGPPDSDSGQKRTLPQRRAPKKAAVVLCDSDIEPEDLIPEFLKAKTKLFVLERPLQEKKGSSAKGGPASKTPALDDEQEMQASKLKAKIDMIEKDVLFDKLFAENEWRAKRIILEKEFSATRATQSAVTDNQEQMPEEASQRGPGEGDDINMEAERMAAEILAQNDEDEDDGISGLFSSLPVTEVDQVTGQTNTVVNGSDGSRVVIRDFAKWTGVSPMRVLEETCRARDSLVRLTYRLVSDVSFANRHMVTVQWTKAQDVTEESFVPEMDVSVSPTKATFTMASIAAPDKTKSEAFVATYALFHIFSSSTKEDKVFLRLPAVWRELYSEYAEVRKNKREAADRKTIKELRGLVRQRQDQDLEEGSILQGFKARVAARNQGEGKDGSSQNQSRQVGSSPEALQNIWAQKSSTRRFQMMLQSRAQLPMWGFKSQVVEAIENHQVVIVCGETGCGKSTQLPSFLLEHQLSQGRHCKIYCTEPRRISAVSLARRVSEELGENRGDLGTGRSLVGYSIRLESKTTRETRLVYATTGIVMRMLEGSNDLSEVTHLVLDEVHERTIDSDFLLIVLKKLMKKRPDLKVVLMSATVDSDRFSKYLGGAPVLTVPGRTYPVQTRFLEDVVELTGYTAGDAPKVKMVDLDDDPADGESDAPTSGASGSMGDLSQYSAKTRATLSQMDEYRIDFDLIVELIAKIATDEAHAVFSKAILVFLPGIAEIRTLNDLLLGNPSFAGSWLVYPLHSSIATEDQEAAFLVPPPGMRKIVLATNIAETGITIPDVTCVVDTGKHKEMRFDERRQLSRLIDTFISRANAKQRRGRAGRVQEGLCFHLFTKHRHDKLISDQQTPEMLRLSLQDLAIRVKICKIGGIEETLNEALDAPSNKNIRRAVDALIDVRALTAGEELTPLGHQLARLPLDVFLGKLMLLGTVFKCLDMAITVAAILSSKSPFSAPFGQRTQADAARMAFRRGDSDLLTIYNAYLAWKRVCQSTAKDFQFCRKNYLSQQTLANVEDLKGQLLVSIVDSGFLQVTDEERRTLNRMRFSGGRGRRQQQFFDVPQRVDVNSEKDEVTTSVIAWSFYPKLLVRDPPGSRSLRNVGNNQSISLHPSSVNRGRPELRWLSYYHIMQSKQVYRAHETTAADAFAIALLCGDVRCDMFSGVLILDGNRARFLVPDWKTMLVIKVLRVRLRELLTRTFKQPGKLPTAQHEKWLDVWQRIFTLEPKDQPGK